MPKRSARTTISWKLSSTPPIGNSTSSSHLFRGKFIPIYEKLYQWISKQHGEVLRVTSDNILAYIQTCTSKQHGEGLRVTSDDILAYIQCFTSLLADLHQLTCLNCPSEPLES
ncbi:hypothetical protein L1887_36203 [Cichorium endivia]|nr:hypothetical protein L1887_36203 [Cichorium endivia]